MTVTAARLINVIAPCSYPQKQEHWKYFYKYIIFTTETLGSASLKENNKMFIQQEWIKLIKSDKCLLILKYSTEATETTIAQ